MKNIQSRIHRVRYIDGCTGIRIPASFSLGFQQLRPVDTVINRFRRLYQSLEICRVSRLGFTARLIRQIFLHLLYVRCHILRIRYAFIFCVAIKLDNIFQKADQRLSIHGHMIHQQVYPLVTVRRLDHHDTVHRRIITFERHSGPRLHRLLCFFHSLPRKIYIFNVPLFFIHYVLIIRSFFVVGKTKSHGIAALIGLVNRLFKFPKIQIYANSQAGSNIQHLFFRAEILIEKVKFLCGSQRIYRISFSFFHHFMIPPINSSRACSYVSGAL